MVVYFKKTFSLDNNKSIVLDLGCGTGQIAKSLCGYVARVVCVDSSEDMIRVSKNSLKNCGDKVEFSCSKAEDFLRPKGSIDLVTISRAFHWMNQDAVMVNCKSILQEGGGLALLGDYTLWNGNASWQKTTKQTIQYFLGEKRRAGNGYFSPPSEPYESMLKRHGFKDVTVKDFEVVRRWNFDSILGYLYSTSFASPIMFDDRLKEFEDTLRKNLGEPKKDDLFDERTIFSVTSGVK